MPFPSFFPRFFRQDQPDAAARVEPYSSDKENPPSYPSVNPGIAARSVDEIVSANQDLIARIKLSYGSDHHTFSQELLSLIRRYVEYVNLLPATADNYFCEAGGLVRVGLETAFYALQGTDSQIFAGRATITNRRHLEPRWRHATFIAGMCSEIHRTLSHVLVTDELGHEWRPYLAPLTDWLRERKATRFFVRWSPQAQETRSLGIFALPMIVPPETMSHLAEGNSIVVPHMMASISGSVVYHEHNILDQLVRRAAALVIDRNLQASGNQLGTTKLGSHLERYLVDALRRLVRSNPSWAPNTERSRVWFGLDGLYVVWPNAMAEVAKILEDDQIPGIPKSPETILEILIEAGVVEPQDEDQATWIIHPPGASAPQEAIRLTAPAIMLASLTPSPSPLGVSLLTVPQGADGKHPQTGTSDPARPAEAPRAGRDGPRKQTANEPGPAFVPGRQLALPEFTEGTPPPRRAPTGPRDECRDMPARLDEGLLGEPSATSVQIDTPSGIAHSRFSLTAPMRLNPGVMTALREIVETLNSAGAGAASIACRTVSTGLFVPLAEFSRRHVDTQIALRSLSDTNLLVHPPGGVQTASHEFDGKQVVGVVIAPQYVNGFCVDDFQELPK